MKIVQHLKDIPALAHPISLTIGTFDALHRGHLSIMDEVLKQKRKSGSAVVLTFSPCPYAFFHPEKKNCQLIPSLYRFSLLEKMGIDWVIDLPFTKDIAELSYDQFLDRLYKILPFDHLVLGNGAAFGKDKHGDENNVLIWAKGKSCKIHYLPLLKINGQKISSSQIRDLVAKGKLEQIQTHLGTPFFLFLSSDEQKQLSSSLCCWKIENQYLPSDGLYELAFSYPLSKGQKTFLGFLYQGNLKVYFSSPVALPEKNLVIFFLKKRFCLPWLSEDLSSIALS